MNTFLPYADFNRSAEVLDRQRLGKQRLECLQIVRTLMGESDGWHNRPAVLMWDGYVQSLLEYGCAVCNEWMCRGYRDSIGEQLLSYVKGVKPVPPPWLGDERFHSSHRSNLLRKDPVHYSKYAWSEPPTLPYFWPTKEPAYAES